MRWPGFVLLSILLLALAAWVAGDTPDEAPATPAPQAETAEEPTPTADEQPTASPNAPPVDLVAARQALRRREDLLLDTYGWVDREAGIAHIPIERAIELVLERGLPTREEPPSEEPEPAAEQGTP